MKYFRYARTVKHAITDEWRNALFDLLDESPRDAIYSILFYLSFVALPTSDDEFAANVELFDLFDDHVRETDALTLDEIRDTRCVSRDSVRKAREIFERSLTDLREKIGRWFAENESSPKLADATTRITLTRDDAEDVRRTLERVRETSVLPARVDPADERCTTAKIPLPEVDREIIFSPSELL